MRALPCMPSPGCEADGAPLAPAPPPPPPAAGAPGSGRRQLASAVKAGAQLGTWPDEEAVPLAAVPCDDGAEAAAPSGRPRRASAGLLRVEEEYGYESEEDSEPDAGAIPSDGDSDDGGGWRGDT